MEETARTLHGTAALVIGYGRIGMALAPRLRGLGMDVTVCARRCETRALAEMQGFAAVPLEQLPAAAKAALVIFNTVPALVLDETVLKGLPQETLVIDLASRPGGTDFEAAKRLRTRVVWALSLPPEMRR
ncbi:MAG: NAD(P)-dependent oxidoreductase [Ruminococcus sp.]